MKTIAKYQLVVLFGLMLILPLLNGILGVVKFERPDENRVFRDSLEFDFGSMDAFPSEAEEYFNDNFSFRTPLLSTYHKLKYNYFKVSPHPDRTMLGKDNWFFLAGAELDDYEGRRQLDEIQLKKIHDEWLNRKSYFDSKGIKYYWMICPSKHEIYADKLPYYAAKSEQMSRTDQVKLQLKDDFPDFIIDPRNALKKARTEFDVYFQLDNHWSYRGGQVAVEELLNRLRSDFPQNEIAMSDRYHWEKMNIQWGIHYATLGIPELESTGDFPSINNEQGKKVPKYGFKQDHAFSYDWEFEERYQNSQSKSKLRVLLIRDSFGDYMRPFIKETFDESVFIFDYWEYKLNPEIIEVVNPDVVVFESISKYLEVFAGEDKTLD